MHSRWAGLIAAGLLFFCSCTRDRGTAADPDAWTSDLEAEVLAADPAPPSAVRASIRPLQESSLTAAQAGYIQSINVDVGTRVARNQVLAIVEPWTGKGPEPADLSITAPFAGVVSARHADTGARVGAGARILELAETDVLRVTAPVPDQLGSRPQIGDAVEVFAPALGRSYRARISALAGDAEQIEAEVLIPNPDLSLKPGMSAEMRFADPEPPVATMCRLLARAAQ